MVGLDFCLHLDGIYYSTSIKVLNVFTVRFRHEINSKAAVVTCLLAMSHHHNCFIELDLLAKDSECYSLECTTEKEDNYFH